jgi:hypothetical protein
MARGRSPTTEDMGLYEELIKSIQSQEPQTDNPVQQLEG